MAFKNEILFTWKLPGVEDAPKGLPVGGESIPDPPGGDGVRIEELLGILKFGLFLVKFCREIEVIRSIAGITTDNDAYLEKSRFLGYIVCRPGR